MEKRLLISWIHGFAIWVTMSCLYAPPLRADWSFVIMGDTRGLHNTDTGVSMYLNSIATKIAEKKPDLVLCCGDQINGNATNGIVSLTYVQQFENWKTAMAPVYALNIPVYTVRGNHENHADEGPPIPELKQAYYDALGVSMPTNGPNNGSTDDQRGYSYSFTHNNASFMVVDQYFYPVSPSGGYHRIDQAWLGQQLRQANTPYNIVMAHEPVFLDHFYGSDTTGMANRAGFWNSLGTNGARLYICGHVHNLSVSLAPDDAGNGIYQLLAGNGGAELDTNPPVPESGVDILYSNNTHYGFALATVHPDSMKIEYYLLKPSDYTWTVASYTTSLSPPVVPAPTNHAGWAVGFSRDGYGTILHSTDSGNTWRRQGAGQIANVQLASVSAVDPYTAWVAGDGSEGYAAIYHTSDGGSTWTPMGATNIALNKIFALDDLNVWAVGVGTVLHTANGGTTWTNLVPAGYEGTHLQGLCAQDATNVWVTGAAKDGFATILHTSDGGGTWIRQGGGGDATNADHILGISAADALTAWAVGGTGKDYIALRTTDGGSTWIRQPDVIGTYDANEVCAVGTGVVWAACDRMIYRSTNGGSNWVGKPAGDYTVGLSAVNELEAWAARSSYNGTIYHTTDGGANWTQINQLGGVDLPGLGAISFANKGILELQISGGDNFGVRSNQFGFIITGTSNLFVMVDASTNLINPTWLPLGGCTLTGGSNYVSDPQWTNYPARFYRPRLP